MAKFFKTNGVTLGFNWWMIIIPLVIILAIIIAYKRYYMMPKSLKIRERFNQAKLEKIAILMA